MNDTESSWSNKKSTSGIGPFWKKVTDDIELPTEFVIHEAYPNPFNPSVSIPFELPQEAKVDIAIYDLMGKQIVHEVHENTGGYYQFNWNGNSNEYGTSPSGEGQNSTTIRKTQNLTLVR